MENSIVSFSSFLEDKPKSNRKEFKKEDFSDFFIKESDETIYNDTLKELEKREKSVKPEKNFDPPVNPEDFIIDDEEPEELDVDSNLGSLKNKNNYNRIEETNENFFCVFRDKTEDFSCDVSVEGAKLSDTQARLVLESNEWTLVFEGKIDSNGRCLIPIKKLNILEEGEIGKIKLEVIAENTIFTPWESEFLVKMSKKVSVKLNETIQQKQNKIINNGPSVGVKFRK